MWKIQRNHKKCDNWVKMWKNPLKSSKKGCEIDGNGLKVQKIEQKSHKKKLKKLWKLAWNMRKFLLIMENWVNVWKKA